MNQDVTAFLFTIGLFTVAMLPLLIDNLRNGTATNRNNLILALAGILSLVIGHLAGWNQQPLWQAAAWIGMGIVILMLPAILGLIPAGVAKMLMAFMPWFTMESYLVVITAAFIAAGIIAWLTKREIPMALPLIVVSFGVWICDFGVQLPM